VTESGWVVHASGGHPEHARPRPGTQQRQQQTGHQERPDHLAGHGRAPTGRAPWPAPALDCQAPWRLWGQGRPQAVAQRSLRPEGALVTCVARHPLRCDTASVAGSPGLFDVDLAGSSLVVECPSRNGYRSAARQLDPTPLPPNVTRPPEPPPTHIHGRPKERPEEFNAVCDGTTADNGFYGEGIVNAGRAVARR